MFTKQDVGNRVVNGTVVELSDSEKQAIADEWNANIQAAWPDRVARERERRLAGTITVMLSDGSNEIPITDRAQALAPEAARRANQSGTGRPFPTSTKTKVLSGSDLQTIADAIDSYLTAVWTRQAELEGLIADGSITDKDINTGWPSRDRT